MRTGILSVVIALTWLATSAYAAGDEVTAVSVAGNGYALHGTLEPALGGTTKASVLIIPGSGPTDRDGNNSHGVEAATYKLLAEGLSKTGIASIRFDKRGLFESAASDVDPNAVTIEAYVDDVQLWVSKFQSLNDGSCVWLLGHSEGGLISLAAAQTVEDICGLILVATPGSTMGNVLRDQLKANPANKPILEEAFEIIDKLERGERVDESDMHRGLRPLFRDEIQGFLISSFSYDPVELIGNYPGPVLILQGAYDIQVNPRDAMKLAIRDNTQFHLLPKVNHVLKYVEQDDLNSNLATYSDSDLPLADGVVDAISSYIFSKLKDNPQPTQN